MNAIDDFFNSEHTRYNKFQELILRFDEIQLAAPLGDISTTEQAWRVLSILESQEQDLVQLQREADHEMQLTHITSQTAIREVDSSNLGRFLKQHQKAHIEKTCDEILTLVQGYKNLMDQWLIQVADWKRAITQFIRVE